MSAPTSRWWKPDPTAPDDCAQRAADLIQETAAIEMRQSTWYQLNHWNSVLLTNRHLPGFHWGVHNGGHAETDMGPVDLRSENLIESIGEAMVSRASSSPLKPTPVPHGRSLEIEAAVRELDSFMFSVWRQTKSEEAAVQSYLDAYVAGLSAVKIGWEPISKAVHVDSVFFDNIVVDNRECANRAPPRTVRIRQVVSREAVESLYGVPLGDQPKYLDDRQVGEGYVVLVEAWRRPDVKGAGGHHSVACAGQLLIDETWEHDWVPVVFFHWQDPVSGFFPKSGVEQLIPYQVRHNDLNDTIELQQDIACRLRMLVHANSSIDVSQWDNEAARMLMYAGVKPEALEWPTNLGDLYNERDRNRGAAFSFMGVSEMGAQMDLPQQVRLDSSAGVREFRNMEDARHLRRWTRFERHRLDIARTTFLVLSTQKGASAYTAVQHPKASRAAAKSIPFEALRKLAADEFSWSLEATPLSSMSPAARRELIRDWTSRGLVKVGSDEARRMEGNSNLERVEELEMAASDDILRHLRLLEKGEYEAPTELTDLTGGIPKVTANYHRLKDYEDVEMTALDNHLNWIVTGTAIQQAAIQAQQQAQMTPFAPTQGVNGTNAGTAPSGPPQ